MNPHLRTRFTPSLPWILLITGLVFFSVLPRVVLSPLLLRIADDLGISFDRASLFFLSSSAGYILGLLMSSIVAARIGHKRTMVMALAVSGGLTMVLSRLRHPVSFHLVLVVANWFVGLYPGSGIASVSMIAPDVHRGKALAIHECGPNFSFILAPVIAAALAPVIGWRGVMLVIGASALAYSILFALVGRAGAHGGGPPDFHQFKALARNRSFWIISILLMVAATAAMGLYSVLPTYLVVTHGLGERLVNNLVGASRITGFIAILSAGTLADRFGFRPVVAVVLLVTGLSTILLGVSRGTLLIVSVFIQPLIVGAYFPVALNALADVTAPERRNLAVALAIPMATLVASGAAPPILAFAGSRGQFPLAFVAVGVLVILSLLLLRLMPDGTNNTGRQD